MIKILESDEYPVIQQIFTLNTKAKFILMKNLKSFHLVYLHDSQSFCPRYEVSIEASNKTSKQESISAIITYYHSFNEQTMNLSVHKLTASLSIITIATLILSYISFRLHRAKDYFPTISETGKFVVNIFCS